MEYKALEILTEELSMEYFLRGLLPRILPQEYVLDQNCFIRPHEGKSHLKKSIPRKMRAYPQYGYPVKVLIVHDQDSNDCITLKNALLDLTRPQAQVVPSLIRIACKELENWYLGDLESVQKVYPEVNARELANKAKYRNPDQLSGSDELAGFSDGFSKTGAARGMGPIINIELNNSPSFQHFISGLAKLINMP